MTPDRSTIGKTRAELTRLVEDAIRREPGCATVQVLGVTALRHGREGRNWQIPQVVLGDSLISDVDRAVMSVQRRLGREFHLIADADDASPVTDDRG